MFLKKIKLSFRQIGVKITLSLLLIFILSFSFLFGIFYLRYSQKLKKYDHQVLEANSNEYQAIYQLGGLPALSHHMSSTNYSNIENSDFFVCIEGQNHKTIFFHTVKKNNFFIQEEIELGLHRNAKRNRWIYIKTNRSEDDIEVLSLKLPDGNYLQVGKSVEDRDLILDRFEESFLEILLIALLLGGFCGIFLSNRLLIPLKRLIATLISINQGHDEARVPLSGNNDELEELALQFNKMLDQITISNQAMKQTLDITAHELRTPLTSIRVQAEINLQKKTLSFEENKNFLEDCIEGIDEILADFKMLTDISEVESRLQNLKKENINLQSLCQDIIDLYEFVAEQKEISLTLMPEVGQENLQINVNRKKIRQALANLIDNAIKYSAENTEIIISFYKLNQYIFIKVIDQGMGIHPDDLPHIWKRLYRGEKSRSEKGIGLGLSLVKSIIEAHNGSIMVKNNNNGGSTFIIELPIT